MANITMEFLAALTLIDAPGGPTPGQDLRDAVISGNAQQIAAALQPFPEVLDGLADTSALTTAIAAIPPDTWEKLDLVWRALAGGELDGLDDGVFC